MSRHWIIILILFCAAAMDAQIRTNISFEKDTVGIGELNNLTIEVVSPRPEWVKSYTLTNFEEIKPSVSFYQNDTMDLKTDAEFDYLDLNTAQPVILNNNSFEKRADGMYVHKNITRFMAWDIGIFRFPELSLQLDTSRRYNVMSVAARDLVVRPPEGVYIDTTQVIAPILPIMREQKGWQDWLWLAYLVLFVLLIILGVFLFLRRKRKLEEVVEEEIIIRPAHEIAFERLDDLDSKNLWQQGKIKEYQSQLTYTVREYLENRFGIQALESTTGEIHKSLKEVDFDPKHTSDLNNILQIADMVKFAKAKPEESIHQEFMDKAQSFVKETLLTVKEDTDGVVE